MASIWVRLRAFLFRKKTKPSNVVFALVALSVVYVTYRLTRTAAGLFPATVLYAHKRPFNDHPMNPKQINRCLGYMDDTRPSFCPALADAQRLHPEIFSNVSIIMSYRDRTFYDFKLSLSAVLTYTPSHQFSEIIVIDDGTSSSAVRSHAEDFFKSPQFARVRVFRSEASEGLSISRLKATRLAKGSYLLYVDSNVVVNQGWLYPLVNELYDVPNSVVVPHHDNFLEGHRFFALDDGLINVPTWTLGTVHAETVHDRKSHTIKTPVMRGDVFGIRRNFLLKLGEFDENIQSGHNIDFSFKSWMCGGQISIVLCSRVVIVSALRPTELTSDGDLAYLSEMWLDSYKTIAYHQKQVSSKVTEDIRLKINAKKSFLKTTLKNCQTFDWYLNNIATDMIVPARDSLFFGKVKAATNLCLKTSTNSVVMELCRPHIYDQDFMFVLLQSGYLQINGRCVVANESLQLEVARCDSAATENRWTLQSDGKLKHRATDLCVTQVPERNHHNELYHYAKLAPCDGHLDSRVQTFSILSY